MILGAILLFIAAAGFVAAELCLPSHGILAVCAAGCAIASVVIATMTSPAMGLLFGLAIAIMAPFVFYWAIRLYPKTPMGKRVILSAPDPVAAAGFEKETERLSHLVGKRGNAMTMLRPAGTIELEGRRIDAVSEAEIIYPNTPVEVIRVSGMKVIVKAVS